MEDTEICSIEVYSTFFLPWVLPPAILKGSDFRRNSNKCPVNLVSKNGLKCCCCPVKIDIGK